MAQHAEHNPLLSPYGTPYGLISGQEGRVEELNQRLLDRNFPDIDFRPNFSPRPVMTKYTLLPVIDTREATRVQLQPYLDYYPEVMFNPGNSRAPVSGFLNRVNLESDLRNQTRPLVSADANLHQYIPSFENSDLYKVVVSTKSDVVQPYPRLFSKINVENSATNLEGKPVGTDVFNNHTRVQVRGLAS
jgi:hypothetical protein